MIEILCMWLQNFNPIASSKFGETLCLRALSPLYKSCYKYIKLDITFKHKKN